ncbi:MAG TPA: energy transducer TonB [Pyrinomonadaceae bacterium]
MFAVLSLLLISGGGENIFAQSPAPAPPPASPPVSAAPVAEEKVYSPAEVETRAIILSDPKPQYPREAGKYDVDGTIELTVVLGADGKVRNLELVKGLSQGQNSAALRAARGIKFLTAKKNGQPVAQSHTVEYVFQFVTIRDGEPAELRGVKKIYVDTGGERKERENITGEILARLPWLEFVDAAREAEVFLEFGMGELTARGAYEMKGQLGMTKKTLEMNTDFKRGTGQVVKRVSETVLHVLLKFQDPQFNSFERKPSTNFARAFVRAYERANGLAEK